MQKITLEEAKRKLFEKHEGKIVLLNYTSMNFPADFECVICGYKWTAKASGIIATGTGCPECAKQKTSEKLRFSSDYIREFIESKNCQWVGGEYKNSNSKLLIKFECGHQNEQTFQSFKIGGRCIKCAYSLKGKNQRHASEEIEKIVESFNYTFLGFPEGYVGRKSLISYRCPLGHITTRKFSIFMKNPNCAECMKKEISIRKRMPIEDISDYIVSRDAEWISGEYLGDDSVLTIKFICGHSRGISYSAFRARKSNLCTDCCLAEKFENNRRPQEEFISIVKNEGFVFNKFIGEYAGNTTKFEYICKECGASNIASGAWFLKHRYCKLCHKKVTRDNRLGEKNAGWKGGTRRLSLFFRKFINDWYVDSLKSTNYKCIITGKPAKAVHHLYPFHKIVDEFLLNKGIFSKMTTSNFSSEELSNLIDEFIPFHNSFGLGIPLTKELHVLFHTIFWTTDNTKEQFYEFQQRISSGEITIPE